MKATLKLDNIDEASKTLNVCRKILPKHCDKDSFRKPEKNSNQEENAEYPLMRLLRQTCRRDAIRRRPKPKYRLRYQNVTG